MFEGEAELLTIVKELFNEKMNIMAEVDVSKHAVAISDIQNAYYRYCYAKLKNQHRANLKQYYEELRKQTLLLLSKLKIEDSVSEKSQNCSVQMGHD